MPLSLIETGRPIFSKELSTGDTMEGKWMEHIRSLFQKVSLAFLIISMQPWFGVEMENFISSRVSFCKKFKFSLV